VLEIRTDLSPGRLLESVKRLEVAMGRQQSFRNGPRLIDVDILLYGESAVELPGLQIPHPRLHQRAFALTPLAELAPRVVHASLGVTIAKLADEADGREGVKLWGPPLSMSIQAV
jgi:7,8-dihydro-6-hydroxymethylpterin-pyrophosphokinase